MHDPRIGRFFAIDPLAPKYPHNSPYAFSENRVTNAVELEGLEAVDNNSNPSETNTNATLPNPFINERNDQGLSIDVSLSPLPGYNVMYFKTLWHDSDRPLGHNTDDNIGTDYYTFRALNDDKFFNFDEPASISYDIQFFNLNSNETAYNDYSLRIYHYKKKIDPLNKFRLNGGVNEFSFNLGQNRILNQWSFLELTFNYGAGFGLVLSAVELEGAGAAEWEKDVYDIDTKVREGYQSNGYGGNAHVGFTSNFQITTRIDLFFEVEGQLHYHHIQELNGVWNAADKYDWDGNLQYYQGELLHLDAYNALGVAFSIGYGMHYRF